MSYFCGLSIDEVRKLTNTEGDLFNHSLVFCVLQDCLTVFPQLHGHVSRECGRSMKAFARSFRLRMRRTGAIGPISPYRAMEEGNDWLLMTGRNTWRKEHLRSLLSQTGKLFDPDVLTIVWAVVLQATSGQTYLLTIWSGSGNYCRIPNTPFKSFGQESHTLLTIPLFRNLTAWHISKEFNNVAVVIGYELALSKGLSRPPTSGSIHGPAGSFRNEWHDGGRNEWCC